MAEIIPGYTTEQWVQTVPNNDAAINDAIATNNAENWVVVSLTLSGTDVIILFTRTQQAS